MKAFKYFAAICILLGGIGNLFKGSAIAASFCLVLGSLILPPISNTLVNNIKVWNIKGFRYATYTILLILIGINVEPNKKLTKSNFKKDEIRKTVAVDKPQIKLSPKDKDESEFWEKFDPIVKQRIYKLIEEKDCAGLQQEFNVTADNMDRLQATGKSGSRNLELMDFLDDEMKRLDCYNN